MVAWLTCLLQDYFGRITFHWGQPVDTQSDTKSPSLCQESWRTKDLGPIGTPLKGMPLDNCRSGLSDRGP